MRRKHIKKIIKEYFFVNPSVHVRVRELERILNLPLPSIIRYCKELEEEKILKTKIISSVKFYTSNKTSEKYLLEKKLFNIRKIYESGLINFLKKEYNNPTIILFGSYLKGEDVEESDIDLYLETHKNKNINLEEFEKILKRKISLLQYKNIHSIKNKFLANNILNGLVLNGFIEVFR